MTGGVIITSLANRRLIKALKSRRSADGIRVGGSQRSPVLSMTAGRVLLPLAAQIKTGEELGPGNTDALSAIPPPHLSPW